MVGMSEGGSFGWRSFVLACGLATCSAALGCTLQNPKYVDSATFGGSSGSESGSSISGGESESLTLSGSGSATGSSGDPTFSGTATAGTNTDTTTATSNVSSTDATTEPTTDATTEPTTDPTTDSGGSSTGGELCVDEDKVDVWLDGDGDGFGGELISVCPGDEPDNAVEVGGDCDDTEININPEKIEVCDGHDNNCNGLKDEYSPQNSSCDLLGGITNKTCYLSEYGGHFYYACKKPRFPEAANGECMSFAVADGAKSYHWKIDNFEEHEEVGGLASSLQDDPSFGLRDDKIFNSKNDHEWVVDGSGLTYGGNFGEPPWAVNQPSNGTEQWTEMDRNTLFWNDIGGLEPRPFICEAEPAG